MCSEVRDEGVVTKGEKERENLVKIYINGESIHRLDRAERTVRTGEQAKDLTRGISINMI